MFSVRYLAPLPQSRLRMNTQTFARVSRLLLLGLVGALQDLCVGLSCPVEPVFPFFAPTVFRTIWCALKYW